MSGEKFLILSPVRGCPYPCTFCTATTYYGKKVRGRSVQKMMDEIAYIKSRFGIDQFFIWADTFTVDEGYVFRFCQAIVEKGLKIHWTCNSRVDTVIQKLLEAMARAGCWMISYGFESGNQAILDNVKKKITIYQSREAVRFAKEAGIKVVGHFALGLPGESEKTLKETIHFSITSGIDMAQFYCAVPFPGSSLYETATEKGWINGKSFEEFRQDNAVMNLPGLKPEIVNLYRKRGFYKFYLRPGRWLQIFRLMAAGGIENSMKAGIRFARWAIS